MTLPSTKFSIIQDCALPYQHSKPRRISSYLSRRIVLRQRRNHGRRAKTQLWNIFVLSKTKKKSKKKTRQCGVCKGWSEQFAAGENKRFDGGEGGTNTRSKGKTAREARSAEYRVLGGVGFTSTPKTKIVTAFFLCFISVMMSSRPAETANVLGDESTGYCGEKTNKHKKNKRLPTEAGGWRFCGQSEQHFI